MDLTITPEIIKTSRGNISQFPKEFMWDQKYRPTTLDECILPASDKLTMRGMIKSGRVENMTLVSDSPGTGKTTLATVLGREVQAEILFVNGADCKIDYIRNVLVPFASSMTMSPGGKLILIDEFDRPGLKDAQMHMRSFIEAYSANCSVAITANNINGIHPALLSRCPPVKFGTPTPADRVAMMKEAIIRSMAILEAEQVQYDNKVLAAFVKKNFPDIRSIIKTLGKYGKRGTIDAGILSEVVGTDIDHIVALLKAKNYKELRSEVIKYASEYDTFVAKLTDTLYPIITKDSRVALIQTVGENNAQFGMAANKEIHLQYLMMSLMLSMAWEGE